MTKIGRPAATSERAALIGRRLKIAAQQAGYPTTTAMAEAMGLDNGTVSRWWTGKRLITPDLLDRYAALVDRHPSWFLFEPDEVTEGLTEDLNERLVAILGQWLHGRPLLEAVTQMTGGRVPLDASDRALFAEADRRLQPRRARGESA